MASRGVRIGIHIAWLQSVDTFKCIWRWNFVFEIMSKLFANPNLQKHIIKRIFPSSLVPQYLALASTSAWAPPVNRHPSYPVRESHSLQEFEISSPPTRHILLSGVTPHTSAVSLKCQQWAICTSSLWEGSRFLIPILSQFHTISGMSTTSCQSHCAHISLIVHHSPCFRCCGISEWQECDLLFFP